MRLPFLRRRPPQSLFVKAPAAACTTAGIFADCFTGCMGPPPVCGWTSFGTGPVTFDGDQQIQTDSVGGGAATTKAHAGIPTVPINTTVQVRFTETVDPPGPLTAAYQFTVTDAGGASGVNLELDNNGAVLLDIGAVGYTGVWAPLGGGATRTAHLTIDGVGIPSLFIDTVPIPLAPGAGGIGTPFPSQVQIQTFHIPPAPIPASYDWFFVAAGIFPPTEVFCCPEGGPAT